jgi:exopolysaccharide biosynthesis polyprenyl glycosylphosphotransferase
MVGSPESVQNLCTAVERDRRMGMQIAGVCVPASEMQRALDMGLPVAGDLDHVAAVTSDLGCHAVAVTGSDATRQSFLRQLAWSLEGVDAELLVHPGLVDVARPRMHIQPYAGLPFLHVEQPHFTGWTRRVKRMMDVSLTSFGLFLIAPILLVIAVAIKLDDRKGPVIFRQTRVGIDGKTFTMYKFRSMCTDAERRLAELAAKNEGAGPLFKIENDPRITRVGRLLRKYSLDELPQLFNVLGGSMSLVGPRPSLPSEVDAYAAPIRRRLKVMPGLTGLWQVSGRSLLSWEESVRLDLWYVENWSIGFDLQILFKTAHAVLAKKGAY